MSKSFDSLGLIVLKTLQALGPLHGYRIARRIEQISGDHLSLNQGTLYPALLRLEQAGMDLRVVDDVGQRPPREDIRPDAGRRETAPRRRSGMAPRHRHRGAILCPRGRRVLSRLRIMLQRLRGSGGDRDADHDLRNEIAGHIDEAVEEQVRLGRAPAEARRDVLRHFGGVAQTEDSYRTQRSLPWLEHLRRDIRFGIRSLRRSTVFSLVVLLVLATGIGGVTAVFTLLNRMSRRCRSSNPIAS